MTIPPGLGFLLGLIGAALVWAIVHSVSRYIDRVMGYPNTRNAATSNNAQTNSPTNSNTLNTASQDCQ